MFRQLRTVRPRLYQTWNHQNPYVKRTPLWRKALYIGTGLLLTAGYASWWVYWPHHTFPSEVATILRKGLWAESNKSEYDYPTALKHYIEALEECDKQGLSQISDEYTGVQIKIAEMYEKLGLKEQALMVYYEMSNAYVTCLTTEDALLQDSKRGHYIQKLLRCGVKIVEMNTNDAELSKRLLTTYLLIAQGEIARKFSQFNPNQQKLTLAPQALKLENGAISINYLKNRPAFEPFAGEFFNARDLLVAIALATNDFSLALRTKFLTTEWMLMADCNPGDILLSQANLGALFYLELEQIEHRMSKEPNNLELKKRQEEMLNMTYKTYDSVLKFCDSLTPQLRRENPSVEESVLLANYGLGVVNLHNGKYDLAEKFLLTAKQKARSSGAQDLIKEADRELQKLYKEKQAEE